MDEIANDEILLRHIPSGTTWQAPGPRITSRNFRLRPGHDVTGLSVTRQKITSANRLVEVVGGDLELGSRVASATAREIRTLGMIVVPKPLADDPGHSEIQSGSLSLDELATSKLLAKTFQFLPVEEQGAEPAEATLP